MPLPTTTRPPLRPVGGALRALSLLALVVTGCSDGGRQASFDEPPTLGAVVTLGRYLYLPNPARGELLVVDPLDEQQPLLRQLALDRAAGAPLVVPAPEGSPPRTLAILEPMRHRLLVVREQPTPASGAAGPVVVTVPLSQTYGRLDASPDGRYLLVTTTRQMAGADFVTVTGKVAVVDLRLLFADDAAVEAVAQAAAGSAVQEQALDLEEAPTDVRLSGPLTLIDGERPLPTEECGGGSGETRRVEENDRHLAALVTSGRLAILDLEHPTLRARTLTFEATGVPHQPTFAPDGDGHPRILYTTGSSSVVTSLTVSLSRDKHACPANEADPTMPELVVDAIDLAAEVRPGGLAVLQGADGIPTLITPSQTRPQVAVLQLRGSLMGTVVDLEVRANQVLALRGSDGRDVALLYDDSGRETRVALLRITDAEGRLSLEPSYSKPFRYGIERVAVVPSAGQFHSRVLVYLRGGNLVEALDLDTGRATAAQFGSAEVDSAFTADGGQLLLVAGDRHAESSVLVRVDLGAGAALRSEALLLDHPPAGVSLLEEAGLVVVDHGKGLGRLTLVPLADFRRESAWMLDGLALQALLGGGR